MATIAFRARCFAAVLMLAALPGAGFAQTPVPPPPNGADYWTEPGFAEFPLKGPTSAKGLLFWSHGLDGRRAQYQYPPPMVIGLFARDGWDVVKVNRNPINETSNWLNSGLKHVRDLAERANKARAEGFRVIVAAGGSYGGAISLEASAKSEQIDAVLALSPGHGSDATNGFGTRNFDSLTDELVKSIEAARAPKIVVQVADKDELHPFEVRGPKLRAALSKKASFVLLDETMPIKGHSAGATTQFAFWFGPCLMRFIGAPVGAGETVCPPPNPVPTFFALRSQKIEPPSAGTPAAVAALSGTWLGRFQGDGLPTAEQQEFGIVVETVSAEKATVILQFGAGPERMLNMNTVRQTAVWEGARFIHRSASGALTISIPPPTGDNLRVTLTMSDGSKPLNVEMRRETAP